eukprot:m.80821 g.80821  ORF g.80821 m.80821 type:complete len:364 (-) comp25352_c0_seq1:337-1428(-)
MAQMQRLILTVTCVALSSGHMSLVTPPSRNAVDRALPPWHGGKWYPYEANCSNPGPKTPANPSGCTPPGTDGWGCNCWNGTDICDVAQSCFWFSQGCTIGCKTCDGGPSNPNTADRCHSGMNATVNDPMHRTFNRAAVAGSAEDIYKHNPWRAPGSAPVYDACGMAGGGPKQQPGEAKYTETSFAKQGDLGSVVLPTAPTGIVWKLGSNVSAKWSIRANHGGGYQYRLCPTTEEVTEECFQQHPLDFASDQHLLEFYDGTTMNITGTYVKDGVLPVGSTWAMNPFPYSNSDSPPEFSPPCNETVDRQKSDTGKCSGRDPFNTLISDQLIVPGTLAPGSYVLGIRWDCEKSAQIWQNCADISIE